MQYDVTSPKEYLDALDEDWRKEKLLQLRSILRKNDANLTEGISYKMLSYGDDKGVIFHLNAQKNYVSLYVGDTKKIDPIGDLLKGIDRGKGCLRFKKSTDVSATQIDIFIDRTIELWQAGVDVGC